jgi:hypothetical protein
MCSCLTILLRVLVVPPMQSVFTFSWGLSSNALMCSLSSPLGHKCITIPCDGHVCIEARKSPLQVQIVSPSLRINLHLQRGVVFLHFLACDFYNIFSFFHLQCFAEGMGSIASSLTSIFVKYTYMVLYKCFSVSVFIKYL